MPESSGRDRMNIHGAVDLETGQTIMKDVLTVDALSTIMLLMAIEAMYPGMRWIHIFLDKARYHHAKTGANVAGAAGQTDQTALHSGLLSAPQPDRTRMGVDAQTYHPQQVLQLLQGLQHRNAELPPRRRAQELAHLLR
jgi:hypothetical protein